MEEEIATEEDPARKKKLEETKESKTKLLVRMRSRLEIGDYFQFKEKADLPDDLEWKNGSEQPEIGDPESKKGGAFRYFISSFPPTIRPFGPNSNNSFRGELYDNVEVAGRASSRDRRNYAGGGQGMGLESRPENGFLSPRSRCQVQRRRPREGGGFHVVGIPARLGQRGYPLVQTVHSGAVVPIHSVWRRPDCDFSSRAQTQARLLRQLASSAPHFYKEYGPDYKERYQWRVPPTTAAYTVKPEDLVKGVSITLSRVDDWWAADKKFYRYRFNADRIRYTVVRDRSKAWELFRAGEIDYFPITLPEYWYQKSEMPPVFDGYVERYTWYNQFPRIPWSLYLNCAQAPLDDHDVRLGISHATNWQKVIDVIFRGDASRLPGWTKGYGRFDNPEIMARPFSVGKAREYFAKAGYVKEDENGILMKENGERLEVALTFSNIPVRAKMMGILKEEALKAGLKFILDGLDHTVVYKKEMQKKHQAVFSAWGFQPPYPRYYEYFHSSNAFDDKGNLKHNTNNVFSFADERMDQLAVAFRNARTEDELEEYAHEMQQIIHDSGVYVPGYMTEFARVGCWRWVRWPDSEFTEFCPPRTYVPFESYVYWIDGDLKKETEEARRSGQKFPEVQAVKQRYRITAESKGERR